MSRLVKAVPRTTWEQKTIARLKTTYKNIQASCAETWTPGGCCVGGALARGVFDSYLSTWVYRGLCSLFGLEYGYPYDGKYDFPPMHDIAATLMKYNSDLSYDVAMSYALDIMSANDLDKDFDEAWRIAEDALAFPYTIIRASSCELRSGNGCEASCGTGI